MSHTCTFQLSTHDIDEFEELGPVRSDQFRRLFEEFEWEEEVNQAAAFKKCAPTLCVVDEQGDVMWVSARADGKAIAYRVSLEHESERSLLGLLKWQSRRVRDFITHDARLVEALFEDFFAGNWDDLGRRMH